jgi:hypothetical protein
MYAYLAQRDELQLPRFNTPFYSGTTVRSKVGDSSTNKQTGPRVPPPKFYVIGFPVLKSKSRTTLL